MRLTLTYICLILISFSAVAQDSILIKKALKFQEKINHEFKDSLESPLPKKILKPLKH